jgi:hypothetical protein
MRSLRVGIALGALLCVGCEPTFKSDPGTVTIDGLSFRPTSCHVVQGGGVALSTSTGDALELVALTKYMDFNDQVTLLPRARYSPRGGTPVELGECGTLTLRGEGYHGKGKRAVSGQASLSCTAGTTIVKGDLTFTGCF